jgi:hypothetical protein
MEVVPQIDEGCFGQQVGDLDQFVERGPSRGVVPLVFAGGRRLGLALTLAALDRGGLLGGGLARAQVVSPGPAVNAEGPVKVDPIPPPGPGHRRCSTSRDCAASTPPT